MPPPFLSLSPSKVPSYPTFCPAPRFSSGKTPVSSRLNLRSPHGPTRYAFSNTCSSQCRTVLMHTLRSLASRLAVSIPFDSSCSTILKTPQTALAYPILTLVYFSDTQPPKATKWHGKLVLDGFRKKVLRLYGKDRIRYLTKRLSGE